MSVRGCKNRRRHVKRAQLSGEACLVGMGRAPKQAGAQIAALIPFDDDLPGRIEALNRLWHARRRKPVPPDTRMTRQQRGRLRLMLQACDGRNRGASYRAIAEAVFGTERVAADPWKTSPLRDRVIGLVEGGSGLIAGGYLRLFRHRRRP